MDPQGGLHLLDANRRAFHPRSLRVANYVVAISKFLNATGKIRRSFRIHLFRAVVEATLMYGGVLWSLSAAERSRLDAFQMKCLRGICGMLHNVDVLKKAKQIPLTKWWKERQLVLAQHILKWR